VILVGFVLGASFSTVFPKTPVELSAQMLVVLPLLAVGLWVAFMGAIYRNILTAFDRFDLLNGIGLIGLVLRAALVVIMLRAGAGLLGLVAAVTISAAVVGVLTLVAASRVYAALAVTWRNFRRARLREMWRFGLVAFATRGSSEIVYQSDQVILMAFLGPHAVAIYGVANMLVLYAQRVVEQLGAVFNPALMKSGSVADLASLRKAYLLYPRAAYYVGIPMYVGFVVFGGDFIGLWVGPQFNEAVIVLKILSIAELASLLTGLGGSLLFGLGRLRFNLYCSMSEALVNVLITVMLVSLTGLGVIGAALGTMVAAIVFRGVCHPLYTTRTIGLPFRRYLANNGWRMLSAAGFAFVAFTAMRLLFRPDSWFGFVAAVAASSAIFGVLGALIMLGRAESLHMFRAMPLVRSKGK